LPIGVAIPDNRAPDAKFLRPGFSVGAGLTSIQDVAANVSNAQIAVIHRRLGERAKSTRSGVWSGTKLKNSACRIPLGLYCAAA
jgi:hypothetical protein